MRTLRLFEIHLIPAMEPPTDNPSFDNLVAGIRKNGLKNPIVIDGLNRCVMGHYRFLAAKVAGAVELPVRFAVPEDFAVPDEQPKKLRGGLQLERD